LRTSFHTAKVTNPPVSGNYKIGNFLGRKFSRQNPLLLKAIKILSKYLKKIDFKTKTY